MFQYFSVTNDEFISQKAIYVMFFLGNILFINEEAEIYSL